jgi:hypothetical protein
VKESLVVYACIQWLCLHKVKWWRQNTGAIKTESGAWVRFGDKGSPDLMCRVPVIIAGRKLATLVGIECKSDTGKLSEDQIAWRDAHVADGGLYIVARSTDDLEAVKSQLAS